ncbi:MAG: sulfatase-like hydrolase/transferase [Chloroflexota bacterium]
MTQTSPNFLVIMTDQHCWHQLACHGNTVVKTPNIDKLFERGTSINGVHTATPMCMPNRQAFLTMRMNSVNGSHSNGVALDMDSNTFPELLRAAGYRTALIGKSHLQNMTNAPAFQVADEVPEGKTAPPEELNQTKKTAGKYLAADYMQERPPMWQDPTFEPQKPYYGFDDLIIASHHFEVAGFHHKRRLDAVDPAIAQKAGRKNAIKASQHNPQTFATAIEPEHYSTRFIADSTMDWLETHAAERAETPFFTWCSITDPHFPWTPPEKYYDLYDPADVILPDSFYESPRTQTPLLNAVYENELKGERKPRMPFMADEAEARRIIATAYGMIAFVDEVVGEIVAKLEETGQADNTVIIFTSDHGDYMGQHGLFLKGPAHYQSLVKVPFIWCDPAQKYNRGAVDGLASYVDIGRTILDRADLWPYHDAQGQSMLPLLAGDTDTHREQVLVETVTFSPQFELPIWSTVRTLVTDQYRLTIYTHLDRGELYDLENDPEEIVNLWDSAEHASVKSDLLFGLAQEMASLADKSRLPMCLA